MGQTPKIPKLVGVSEAAEILGWKTTMVNSYKSRDSFPQPVAYLRMGPIWTEAQIEQFREVIKRRKLLREYAGAGNKEGIRNIIKEFLDWCHDEVGHVPSTYEYKRWAQEHHAPDYTTVRNYVLDKRGTWEQVLAMFGMELDEKPSYTREDCINALLNCARQKRIKFTMSEYDQWARGRRGIPSASFIQKMFGTFNEAKREVGLPVNVSKK